MKKRATWPKPVDKMDLNFERHCFRRDTPSPDVYSPSPFSISITICFKYPILYAPPKNICYICMRHPPTYFPLHTLPTLLPPSLSLYTHSHSLQSFTHFYFFSTLPLLVPQAPEGWGQPSCQVAQYRGSRPLLPREASTRTESVLVPSACTL